MPTLTPRVPFRNTRSCHRQLLMLTRGELQQSSRPNAIAMLGGLIKVQNKCLDIGMIGEEVTSQSMTQIAL